jgi:hypothetical protein
MNRLSELAGNLFGLKKLWVVCDGYVTKIAAVAGILTGLGGLVNGLLAAYAKHDPAALLAYFQGLPADQNWLMIIGGLAVFGIGRKVDKLMLAVRNTPAMSARTRCKCR